MAMQEQNSSFAKNLGGRVAAANAEHAGKPIDTGMRRLPAGIRNGIAKLSTMYTKAYEDDKNGPGTKGQTFFRASAIVVAPEEHNGEKVAGQVTTMVIPLCDMPAKGQRKAVSFSENWFEFQNVFKLLGVAPCPETPATDPTGARTEAYFFAAIKMLCDPERQKTNPTYISFSTRGWTPPPNALQPKPEEMVFETWHGKAEAPPPPNPAVGVVDNLPPNTPPAQRPATPQAKVQAAPAAPEFNEFTPPTGNTIPQDADELVDLVSRLLEAAMNDPIGATEEGAEAGIQLQNLAVAAGWTQEQTEAASDWSVVADMALNNPDTQTTAPVDFSKSAKRLVSVGSKWLYAKRDKDGVKLKDKNNKEFAPQEVEVTDIAADGRTCNVKTTKDGKDIVDLRSKKPVAVKIEWLEQPK